MHSRWGQNNQAGDGDGDPEGSRLATVGGGWQNTAGGDFTTVAGGAGNTAGGDLATVAGGHLNSAGGAGSTVGGGESNSAAGDDATVGGGGWNTAAELWATVGGGNNNTAGGSRATVAGGSNNSAGGDWATIAGGSENSAGGDYAAVVGGNINMAQGAYSFAIGHRAQAYNAGCFVWGDSSAADVPCNDDNRWVARATGGVYFYTNSALTSGSYLAAGGSSWNSITGRAARQNLSPVDGRAILEALASLPVQEYNLKGQDDSIRHVGLVAQDFAAFGYGESDTAINMADADGVAMAAIQALYAENQALQAENAGLAARVTALEQAVQCPGFSCPESGAPAQSGTRLSIPWLLAGGLVVAGGTLAARRRGPGGGR